MKQTTISVNNYRTPSEGKSFFKNNSYLNFVSVVYRIMVFVLSEEEAFSNALEGSIGWVKF